MKTAPLAAMLFPCLVLTMENPTEEESILPEVIAEVVDFLQWRDTTIVYDTSLSLKSKHDLLAKLVGQHIGLITLELPEPHSDVISSVINAIESTTIWTVLLYVRPETAAMFLTQAKESNVLHPKYQWLVIGPDARSLLLEEVLRCVPCNVALMIPSTPSLDLLPSPRQLSPSSQDNDTDPVEDDLFRQPTNFTVYGFDPRTARFSPVATWTATSRLAVFYDIASLDLFSHFHNATLRVGAWQAEPFTKRVKENGTVVQYEGFSIAILQEMALYLNFSYEFIEPPDGLFGAPDDNNTWNGMMAMLISGELDLAVGPITITPERKEVVDFTVPYMEDGGGILTKRDKCRADLLNVFRPFSLTVWLMMAIAVAVTAVLLFAITQLSSHPRRLCVVGDKDTGVELSCRKGAKFSHQSPPWTFSECVWVIYGSVMNQGASRHPETISGRVVLGCWWMFTILIVSMYTASLAALLTVKKEGEVIDTVEDLAESSLDPIFIAGSNWWTLFTKSDSDVYSTIASRMGVVPPVKSTDEALDLVYAGSGGIVHDASQLRFLYGLDCQNLYMSNTIFNGNGMGFAMPKNAYYKKAMNTVILKLQEGGFLERWKKTWWETSPECGAHTGAVSSAQQLRIISIGGILLMYLVFIALALFIHTLQWLPSWSTCLAALRHWMKLRGTSSGRGGVGGDAGGGGGGWQTQEVHGGGAWQGGKSQG